MASPSLGGTAGLQQANLLDDHALRNFREFLQTYNLVSEHCFQRCVVNLNRRTLADEEASCLDACTAKSVNLNHRLLSSFMVEQPRITEQKIAKAQKEAEEAMEKMKAQGVDATNVSPEEMAQRMMSGMQDTVPNPQAPPQQ